MHSTHEVGYSLVVPIPDIVKRDADTVNPMPNAHFTKIKCRLPTR